MPSYAHVNAGVVLHLHAGMTGLIPAENAESGMLRLDDEVAGLIEAADMPADQAGANAPKPEPVPPMPGEAQFMHSMFAAARPRTVVGFAWGSALHFCSMAKSHLCCNALHVLPLPCRAVIHSCSFPLQAMPTQAATRQWSTDEVTTAVAFVQDDLCSRN